MLIVILTMTCILFDNDNGDVDFIAKELEAMKICVTLDCWDPGTGEQLSEHVVGLLRDLE